ncbi:HNH endonuclease [Cronobacter sakazakii]
MSEELTQTYLKTILNYDPLTGLFSWLDRSRATKSKGFAGTVTKNGYINICINGKYLKAHRLAWLYVHGCFPPAFLDHINGVRSDNRIENLRECDRMSNQRNSSSIKGTSSLKGVSYYARSGKWTAGIRINGKYKYLGRYKTQEEAHAMYCFAAWRFFGEFARYN